MRIRCYRHEGIVVANQQRVRGLGWLRATWELTLPGGRTLTAPAELPDLRPGETAAVPLPLPLELPEDGRAVWLTLRVVTAGDQPWAPPGAEVCAPRIALRASADASRETADPSRATTAVSRGPADAPRRALVAGHRRPAHTAADPHGEPAPRQGGVRIVTRPLPVSSVVPR